MIRTFYRSVFFLTVAALAVALPHALSAQSKIAYLDAGKLLKRMPEAKDAESRMTQLIAAWTKESGELQAEIDRKQSDFDRRKLIMTDAERNALQLELQNLRKKLDD